MVNKKDNSSRRIETLKSIQLLEVITPLVKRLNCLDIKRIAEVCINEIPNLIGARLASLYILDDTSDILHLEKNNHPFLINNIVSLNQNPPSPMVAAVRSKELMETQDDPSFWCDGGVPRGRVDLGDEFEFPGSASARCAKEQQKKQ